MTERCAPIVFPDTVPQIGSVGLPPQQHADRITAEMIRYLIKIRAAAVGAR
jgi:hypothetical protein